MRTRADVARPRPVRTNRIAWWLLAAAFSIVMTLTNQMWVGGMTIYREDRESARQRLHEAIINNRLPPGVESWRALGANRSNIRLAVVWTAELLQRATGQPLARCYFAIESLGLLLCCLLLYWLLETCCGAPLAMAGLLYFGTVLSLTYLLHHFQPWDRPSLAVWLASLLCAYYRRWALLALVLLVGMAIKFDIVVFPLFVFLLERRRSEVRTALLTAGVLAAITGTVFVLLNWLVPGGFESGSFSARIFRNVEHLASYNLRHPVLLALTIPAALAAWGYRYADDFARSTAEFALFLSGVFFLETNFVELRQQVPTLVFLMPAAAAAVRRLSDGQAA